MRFLLAVSGGVDSVVLLDSFVKKYPGRCAVAHFDHGIRPTSSEDAAFVAALAAKYNVEVYHKREVLGVDTSEAVARRQRYNFLFQTAKTLNAQLVTAHHGDDMIESMAINLKRGTGWRGLTPMSDQSIYRPLLKMFKADVYAYALKHNLEFVEDETNSSTKYLRNRLRQQLAAMTSYQKASLLELFTKQRTLRQAIDTETLKLLSGNKLSRYFFTMIDQASALELLRAALAEHDKSATRPQRRDMLLAVKTAQPGTERDIASNVRVRFTTRQFIVNQ